MIRRLALSTALAAISLVSAAAAPSPELLAKPTAAPTFATGDDIQWFSEILNKCSPQEPVEGDGSQCTAVTVQNAGGLGSELDVKVTYANGTIGTATLAPGGTKTFTCKIVQVQVHEKKKDAGLVKWHVQI